MRKFQVVAPYQPSGDQPQAIERLAGGFLRGDKYQTLKGVTGSGKTFTMAKIIEAVQRPTLIISHNKTLSAQLYREFKSFFPHNAVVYHQTRIPVVVEICSAAYHRIDLGRQGAGLP